MLWTAANSSHRDSAASTSWQPPFVLYLSDEGGVVSIADSAGRVRWYRFSLATNPPSIRFRDSVFALSVPGADLSEPLTLTMAVQTDANRTALIDAVLAATYAFNVSVLDGVADRNHFVVFDADQPTLHAMRNGALSERLAFRRLTRFCAQTRRRSSLRLSSRLRRDDGVPSPTTTTRSR